MWIASKIGFFSIVVKDGKLHVRGRSREDILNLAGRLGGAAVHEWPTADYRFRLILPRSDLYTIMDIFGTMVTYPNFKSEIAEIPGQRDKLVVYHEVWATMARWAEDREPRGGGTDEKGTSVDHGKRPGTGPEVPDRNQGRRIH